MRNPFKPLPITFTAEEEKLFGRSRFSTSVKKQLKTGKCDTKFVQKAVLDSSVKCCPKKVKHTKLTIDAALRRDWSNTHAYKCPVCSFLHVGRPCEWATLAEKKIVESEAPVVKIIKSIKRRFK